MKTYVSAASKLPEVEHFAIITTTSTDDGYGGRSDAIEYVAFSDRDEWEAEIRELALRPYGRSFRAMEVKPARLVIQVKVG